MLSTGRRKSSCIRVRGSEDIRNGDLYIIMCIRNNLLLDIFEPYNIILSSYVTEQQRYAIRLVVTVTGFSKILQNHRIIRM